MKPGLSKGIVIPVVLIGICYLLTLGPIFHYYNNGLFIVAVSVSAYFGGTKSGVLAFVLALFVLVMWANPWHRDRTVMAYFSFAIASGAIIWFDYRLKSVLEKLRRHELAIARQEAALVGEKVRNSSHQLVGILSAISGYVEMIPTDNAESIEAITSLARKGSRILRDISTEATRLNGGNNINGGQTG